MILTPKEKAIELIDKYKNINHVVLVFLKDKAKLWIAKQGALIAVDEIVNSNAKVHLAKRNIYWQEVKKEIEDYDV